MTDPVRVMVGLGHALRAARVPATPDRVTHAVRAVAALDPGRRDDVYWAGRSSLCASRDDIARYDEVFAACYDADQPPMHQTRRNALLRVVPVALADPGLPPDDDAGEEGAAAQLLRAAASTAEVLRHKDIASLVDPERDALNRALATLSMRPEHRRSRRRRAATTGAVDPARTARAMLATGGEVAVLAHRRRRSRPRTVVLLVDVSGSMATYADALLRFAHAAGRTDPLAGRQAGRTDPMAGRQAGRTEVFAVGTRLTRLSDELGVRDPGSAMAAVAGAIPDWGGGTRLGAGLGEFLDRYGRRGMARGAVVVILSDGWERDDPDRLGAQMARLSRLAHRVVWANPRKGHQGYAPVAVGMAAALPYVDDFVAGHSLAALTELASAVAGERARRGAGHA